MGLYYRALYYDAGQNNIRLVVPVWATAAAERYTAWDDSEADSLSLWEMNLGNGSIRKKTKLEM
ncbi:hypothetical protein E5D57_011084 [Metarhizium anisopliae]|nr:hypothetical protein E5D57_011084 [Metarhizium anisopliae]